MENSRGTPCLIELDNHSYEEDSWLICNNHLHKLFGIQNIFAAKETKESSGVVRISVLLVKEFLNIPLLQDLNNKVFQNHVSSFIGVIKTKYANADLMGKIMTQLLNLNFDSTNPCELKNKIPHLWLDNPYTYLIVTNELTGEVRFINTFTPYLRIVLAFFKPSFIFSGIPPCLRNKSQTTLQELYQYETKEFTPPNCAVKSVSNNELRIVELGKNIHMYNPKAKHSIADQLVIFAITCISDSNVDTIFVHNKNSC